MDAAKKKGEEEQGYNIRNKHVVVIGDDDIDTGLGGDLKKKMVLDKDAESWRVFWKIYNNFCTEEIEAAGYTVLEDDTTTLDTSRAFEWRNIPRPEEKARPEEKEEDDDDDKYFTKPPGPLPYDPFVHDGGVYTV